ncbi:MAG: hypothetical protein GY710_06895 [Desulfobacteraceae bacterium]|nr:hypothetical protein [Desulfobacteraceae bacterium]
MTYIASLGFLIAVLFIVDIFLVVLLVLFVKRVNQMNLGSGNGKVGVPSDVPEENTAFESAREIIDMLEPLVMESRKAALSFGEQIREKRKLSKDLNDALDTRIISINLLLSRADAFQKKLEDRQHTIQQTEPVLKTAHSSFRGSNVLDQQNQIIDLYYQKVNVDTIAEKLSIPKGEVQLVIDLKEKFIAMERGQ